MSEFYEEYKGKFYFVDTQINNQIRDAVRFEQEIIETDNLEERNDLKVRLVDAQESIKFWQERKQVIKDEIKQIQINADLILQEYGLN